MCGKDTHQLFNVEDFDPLCKACFDRFTKQSPIVRPDEVISDLRWRIRRLELENDRRKFHLDGMPFCPDHRDKVAGKPCRECENERLRRALQSIARLECPHYTQTDTFFRRAREIAQQALEDVE